MTRIPYMNDLINYLRADPGVVGVGLQHNILVYSEWTIEKLTRDWNSGIIIQPLSATSITSTDRRTGCKGNFETELIVAVQTRNPSSTQQHFVVDQQVPDWQVTGAYPDAAALEEIVRNAISGFNAANVGATYDPFVLLELQEAEESNGFLVLKQLYKTRFMF